MKCPYCGEEMTYTGNDWYRCPKCEATHNDIKKRKRKVERRGLVSQE